MSTTELVQLISKFLEKKIVLFKVPRFVIRGGIWIMPRIFERLFGSYEMDNTSTLQKLNFSPPFTTEQCLEKLVISFKQNKKNH
jgi:hypothetical protein